MTDYRKLDIAAKQAVQLERSREPEVECPTCEVKTTPADLLSHMDTRCEGPRDPGPAARWISRSEARKLGASIKSLERWAREDLVRTQGARRQRRFLQRDVVRRLAFQRVL
jgi:hypothetical protein